MLWIVVLVLLILVIGGLPHWGYWGPTYANAGYYPSGVLGIVLVIIVVLLLLGRI